MIYASRFMRVRSKNNATRQHQDRIHAFAQSPHHLRLCEVVDGARLPVERSWRLAREALLVAAIQSDGGTSAAGDDMRRSARGPPASAVMIAFFHSERMRPLVTVRPLVSTRTTTLEGPETEKKLLDFGCSKTVMMPVEGSTWTSGLKDGRKKEASGL